MLYLIVFILFLYLIKFVIFLIKRVAANNSLKKRPAGFFLQPDALWIDDKYTNPTTVKALHELTDPIAPVLEFWNDPSAEEFPCFVGDSLNARVKQAKANLRRNGIRRHLIVAPYYIHPTDSGKNFRKWDDGGREWQASDLDATIMEEYFAADGSLLNSFHYPLVHLTPIISRRLAANDKATAHRRDKWGRKAKPVSFYEDKRISTCPSCGAELPEDSKDPICPYCNSTIFSDYYDWQIEGIEFTPEEPEFHMYIDSLSWLFFSEKIGTRVAFKHKYKGQKRVVRFSENAFYYDVYDSCLEAADKDRLIDLWLGKIEVLKATHTEKETFLRIRVPVWTTLLTPDGKVIKQKEIKKATFVRTRYPNKFDKHHAVIAEEKQCPNCGGEYAVDSQGKCIHCGTYLHADNNHWKLQE